MTTTSPSARQTEIIDAVQVSDPGSELIVLYEVEHSLGQYAYFTPYNGSDFNDIQFENKAGTKIYTYNAIPIDAEGFDVSNSGAYNRPLLTIANIDSLFADSTGSINFEELTGRKVIRRITLAKYLVGGSAYTAGSPVEFPSSTYIIDRIKEKNILQVVFELATPFDLPGTMLPKRKVFGGRCPWKYKGAADYIPENAKIGGCSWDPSKGYFLLADLPDGSTLAGGYTPQQFEEAKVASPIYVNEKDEFIIRKDHAIFYDITDDGVGTVTWDGNEAGKNALTEIEPGYYFRTTDTAVEVESDGRTKTDRVVYRYWQSLDYITLESAHLPSTEVDIGGNFYKVVPSLPTQNVKNLWREVRVYTLYDSKLSYKGYESSEYNEYVLGSSGSGLPPRRINIVEFSPYNADTIQFYIGDILAQGDYNDFIVEGYSRTNLNIGEEGLGAVPDVSYTLSGSKDTIFLHINTTDTSITLAPISYTSGALKKVKRATVEPITIQNSAASNIFSGSKWIEGDVCGKTITSCSKRFKSVVVESAPPTSLSAPPAPAPVEIEFCSGTDIVGGKIRLDSTVFAALPTEGVLRSGFGNDFYHFALSDSFDPAIHNTRGSAEQAVLFSRYLQDIQLSSVGANYTDGFTISGTYAGSAFFGVGGSNTSGSGPGLDRLSNYFSYATLGDYVGPAAINFNNLAESSMYRPMSEASMYDTPYRGSGNIPNPPIPNGTPIFNSVYNEVRDAVLSQAEYELEWSARGFGYIPNTQAYTDYYNLNYAGLLEGLDNRTFFQDITLTYKKVPSSSTDIQLFLDPLRYYKGGNIFAMAYMYASPTAFDLIPLNLSTPASAAYQQFAYSNEGDTVTTEDHFLTGKMYLTDDRTATGNDMVLYMDWSPGGGVTGTTGTISVEPNENETLPFGGFPGSRRFQ